MHRLRHVTGVRQKMPWMPRTWGCTGKANEGNIRPYWGDLLAQRHCPVTQAPYPAEVTWGQSDVLPRRGPVRALTPRPSVNGDSGLIWAVPRGRSERPGMRARTAPWHGHPGNVRKAAPAPSRCPDSGVGTSEELSGYCLLLASWTVCNAATEWWNPSEWR